jgi:hypothetical protein
MILLPRVVLPCAVVLLALAGCGGGAGGPPRPPDPNPPLSGDVPLGRAVTLASGVALAAGPQAAFSSDDTATVVWAQAGFPIPGSGLTRIVPDVGGAESQVGETWSAAELINGSTSLQDQAGDSLVDLVASPGRGGAGAQAAWRRVRTASSAADVLLSARREGVGWSPASIAAEPAGVTFTSLRVASNGLGTDAAVWVETLGGLSQVQLSVRSPGTSWGPKRAVQTDSFLSGTEPAVAVDESGTVMVLWRQGAAGAGVVWARRFPFDGSSTLPFSVDGPLPPDSGSPTVIATAADRFMATWLRTEQDGVTRSLRAREAVGGLWPAGTRPIELQDLSVDEVQLAALPAGGALAVWRQGGALKWSRYAAGSWLNTPLDVDGGVAGAAAPQLATDATGRGFVAWLRRAGAVDDLLVATLAPLGDRFSAPQSARLGDGSASLPSLAVAPEGTGSVVLAWRQAVAGQAEPDLLVRLWRR